MTEIPLLLYYSLQRLVPYHKSQAASFSSRQFIQESQPIIQESQPIFYRKHRERKHLNYSSQHGCLPLHHRYPETIVLDFGLNGSRKASLELSNTYSY